MVNIIINNPKEKYNFENFTKEELKFAKIINKINFRENKNKYNKKTLTVATHKLNQRTKKYYYLEMLNFYKDIVLFENIEKIEFKRIDNREIVIIEGIISVNGIKNNYGFYNLEDDLFIPIEELEENKNLLIETLSGPDVLHYVKKRVR